MKGFHKKSFFSRMMASLSENCIRRQVLGNKYLVYMNHHQNNQGGDSEGGTKSTGEIIKAVLR